MINKLPHTAEMLRGTAGLVLKNDNLPRTCYTTCNDAAHRLDACYHLLKRIDGIMQQWFADELEDSEAMDLIAIELDESTEPEWN